MMNANDFYTQWSKIPGAIAKATVYRARVGARREYSTEADALAYEAGYQDALDGTIRESLMTTWPSPYQSGVVDEIMEEETSACAETFAYPSADSGLPDWNEDDRREGGF